MMKTGLAQTPDELLAIIFPQTKSYVDQKAAEIKTAALQEIDVKSKAAGDRAETAVWKAGLIGGAIGALAGLGVGILIARRR